MAAGFAQTGAKGAGDYTVALVGMGKDRGPSASWHGSHNPCPE